MHFRLFSAILELDIVNHANHMFKITVDVVVVKTSIITVLCKLPCHPIWVAGFFICELVGHLSYFITYLSL